jgi:hypothetical protein
MSIFILGLPSGTVYFGVSSFIKKKINILNYARNQINLIFFLIYKTENFKLRFFGFLLPYCGVYKFEAKWRKNCCAIKILKILNIAISLNLMIQIALFSSFFTLQILRKC